MKILETGSINKILVIRLSSMGDVILTTSFIRQLKNRFQRAEIDFCVAGPFSEILKFNPHIANIVEYNKNNSINNINLQKKALRDKNQGKKYGLIIDLQKNFRSCHFRMGLGENILKVNKNRLKKIALVKFKKNLYGDIALIPDIYSLAAQPAGVATDGKGLELWLEKDAAAGEYLPLIEKPDNTHRNRIAIAPGAFHYTKRWPAEKFAKLIRELKNKYKSEIILVGGVKDSDLCKMIIEKSGVDAEDLSGATSILESAGIIDECRLLITNDTGVMHIAAARQVPVAAIFGSTVREFGFTPYRVKHEIIEKNIPCRPCTHTGRAECPLGHFNCMNLISVGDVLGAVERLI